MSLPVMAGSTITLSQFPPNPNVLPGGGWQFTEGTTFGEPPPPRAWVEGVYGGVPEVVATDSIALAGRAGPLAVTAAESVGVGDAAVAVASCLATKVTCVAAASAAYLLYRHYRTQSDGDGGLQFDPGQPTTLQDAWADQNLLVDYPSPQAASDAAFAVFMQQNYAAYTTQIVSQTTCAISGSPAAENYFCSGGQYELYNATTKSWSAPSSFADSVVHKTAKMCPALIDFSDPAYDTPGGATGPDGLCPTGRYQPISVADAAQQVAQFAPSSPTDMSNLMGGLQQSLSQGLTVPATISTSGPATQTGTPQTTATTSSSGTVTGTSTPTYTYNYAGDTITYTSSNTTVTNNGGATTTTTTTTPPAAPQDPNDPCTANPDRLGCMELGDTPTDQVPKGSQTLTWAEEDPSLPSSCPADTSIATSSGSIVVSYQKTCDAATTARPFIVASGYFAALMIVVAALRGT